MGASASGRVAQWCTNALHPDIASEINLHRRRSGMFPCRFCFRREMVGPGKSPTLYFLRGGPGRCERGVNIRCGLLKHFRSILRAVLSLACSTRLHRSVPAKGLNDEVLEWVRDALRASHCSPIRMARMISGKRKESIYSRRDRTAAGRKPKFCPLIAPFFPRRRTVSENRSDPGLSARP